MQDGPNVSALRARTNSSAGCGSRQRRSPTGGCAKGIPLKLRTPSFGGYGGFEYAVRRLHPVGAGGRQRRGSAEEDSGNEHVRRSSHQSLDSGGS